MYARGWPTASTRHGAAVALPGHADVRQLQLDLAELAEELDLIAHLQHENVFLATSEIGAVRSLTI